MHKMEELRDMLCDELNEITKQGKVTSSNLDMIDKLTHSIKSIDTILAMEDAGYSNQSGYSYARGRGSNARRDSMGRYSNRGRGGSYDDGSYERGYSREDAKEELAMGLRELKMDAKDHDTAKMIDKWIRQLEQD